MKKTIFFALASALSIAASAQQIHPRGLGAGSEGTSTYCGNYTVIRDQVLDSTHRFGHLLSGQYGNPWSAWSAIGRPNIGHAPIDKSFYGYFVNNQSDRVFFGLKNIPPGPEIDRVADSSDAVVAWGDDDNRLFFEFHGYQSGCNATVRQVAQMTHNGKVGIGQSNGAFPAARLHVNANNNLPSGNNNVVNGIRFEGLPIATYDTVLIIDPAGNLAKRVYPGGVTQTGVLNCNNPNFIPKVGAAGNDLVCSQIFDNGTSVGIGTQGPFGFGPTWPGGLTGINAPPSAGFYKLDVFGTTRAVAYHATSDKRFKKEINPIGNAMSIINKLEGKTYFWRTDEFKDKGFTTLKQYGFIAQELELVIPEVVATDSKGYKSVNYDMIIPILTQAIKEQQKQIDALESRLNASENKTGSVNGINQSSQISDGFALDQNIPNPFSNETVIGYKLTKDTKAASLVVYDLSGKQLTSFPLEMTANSITITSEKLAAGIYIYSVMADGKIMDSKRMVIAGK